MLWHIVTIAWHVHQSKALIDQKLLHGLRVTLERKDTARFYLSLVILYLTLKVLVTTIDALGHFETGQLQHSARGWGR